MVLARRGGLGHRPKDKLQTRYTGPYVVLERPDPTQSIVHIAHIATKKVEARHMNELVNCDMSHFRSVQEAIPFALITSLLYNGFTLKNPFKDYHYLSGFALNVFKLWGLMPTIVIGKPHFYKCI